MLQSVEELCPDIYPLVHSSYSVESHILWEGHIIQSAEGVQQGDPLGPLLFCLTIHKYVSSLTSELCVCYLDDISVGGAEEALLNDIVLTREATQLGLVLNSNKTEIICSDVAFSDRLLQELPGASVIKPSDARLLGSPIGDLETVDSAIREGISDLQRIGERLQYFSSHDAILLLRHSFSLPKLVYLLRTAPAFLSPALQKYDIMLCSLLSSITIVQLEIDSPAWIQASLPVKYGGLGFRSAVQLAPSCFLSSAAAAQDLITSILPSSLQSVPFLYEDEALACWSDKIPNPAPPMDEDRCHQKAWDLPQVTSTQHFLLSAASDDLTRARLISVFTPEAGAWLQALPISSLGLRLDDEAVRIAVGLRLGLPICTPHVCHQCGARVDEFAHHGLSCKRGGGKHHRHAAINDVLHRALSSAGIPSTLEPSNLQRSDGKRPDGLTMIPWAGGRPLVWDSTVVDSLPSHTGQWLLQVLGRLRPVLK